MLTGVKSRVRSIFWIRLLFVTIPALPAVSYAQAPYSELKTLGQFVPTVLDSEKHAKALFKLFPRSNFKNDSECHQRAHLWAYTFNQSRNLRSMKVFLLFTERYQREFGYTWGYHVAPLIPVRTESGTIEEQVFDPTFVAAGKPVTVSEWLKYFIFPNVDCPLIENYQDYEKHQERGYCFIMKAPMYTYTPDNLDSETKVRTTWKASDLKDMHRGVKR